MKVKLIDLLKEEIIEQGGKFRDAVNLQGKSVANVARIGDDGTVKSTYTRIYPKTQKSESLEGYDESRALEFVDFGKEIKQNLVIKSFIKYKVGEGIEVKKTDFNEEVKSLAGA